MLALPVAELLMPPELHAKQRALAALETFRQARAEYATALAGLVEVATGDPLVEDIVNEQFTDADSPFGVGVKPRIKDGVMFGAHWSDAPWPVPTDEESDRG